jgi:hypothetical protein
LGRKSRCKLKKILEEISRRGLVRTNEEIHTEELVREEKRKKGHIIYTKAGNEWASKVGDMSLGMILAGFHHAEQNMKEFRKAEIFTREHLYDILKDLSAVDELLE